MVSQINLTGMVISSMPIGEYDKRLVLLTAQRGKITAFCRGSRRQNSTMLGATEPCVFGEFTLVEGRSAYTLVGANIKKYYMELRADIESASLAFYCLEFGAYFTRENMEAVSVLNLLAATFNALCKKKVDAKLIRRVFELKMLALSGEYPQMFECVKCGRTEQLGLFSMDLFGMICPLCKKYAHRTSAISQSALYAMQYVISADIEKLYTFSLKPEVFKEFETMTDFCVRKVLDRPLKSAQMLDLIL